MTDTQLQEAALKFAEATVEDADLSPVIKKVIQNIVCDSYIAGAYFIGRHYAAPSLTIKTCADCKGHNIIDEDSILQCKDCQTIYDSSEDRP